MARMPSGTPRSVPDPYGDDYDEMMRQWLAQSHPDANDVSAAPVGLGEQGNEPPNHRPTIGRATALDYAIPPIADARNAIESLQEMGRPHSLAESVVPYFGSGREAAADLQDGNYLGAGFNGALAASDLFLAGSIVKGLLKGGAKMSGPFAWKIKPRVDEVGARQWLGANGFLEPGQAGHHWGIPQGGWGKLVPDWIKNQPWNIKPMPSSEIHGRIHGRYLGKPRFNPAEQYWRATPAWSKAATVAAVGHPVAIASGAGRPAQ